MQRISSVAPASATGRVRELFDQLEQAFGAVPNTAQVMANSPAVLESFVAFANAMSGVGIGGKLHNQVKLSTSETNACEYCTSILSAVAPSAGLSADDVVAGRTASADDARTDAALKFAAAVLDTGGNVSDAQLQAVRDQGFGDAEIVEIVTSVVLGCFTNFLNNVADTELDVPAAGPVGQACASGACGVAS
ncbi:MAG: peroxidase [Planctomycetaceae bacterium]|nr:peroxidase [Planctomycetaceae bacterium]